MFHSGEFPSLPLLSARLRVMARDLMTGSVVNLKLNLAEVEEAESEVEAELSVQCWR